MWWAAPEPARCCAPRARLTPLCSPAHAQADRLKSLRPTLEFALTKVCVFIIAITSSRSSSQQQRPLSRPPGPRLPARAGRRGAPPRGGARRDPRRRIRRPQGPPPTLASTHRPSFRPSLRPLRLLRYATRGVLLSKPPSPPGAPPPQVNCSGAPPQPEQGPTPADRLAAARASGQAAEVSVSARDVALAFGFHSTKAECCFLGAGAPTARRRGLLSSPTPHPSFCCGAPLEPPTHHAPSRSLPAPPTPPKACRPTWGSWSSAGRTRKRPTGSAARAAGARTRRRSPSVRAAHGSAAGGAALCVLPCRPWPGALSLRRLACEPLPCAPPPQPSRFLWWRPRPTSTDE